MLSLQRYSAVLFYALGLSVALAYIFLRKDIGGPWPIWWLRIADLPLLFTGLLYGSASLYRSLQSVVQPSRALPFAVFVPATLLFLAIATLNFWPLMRL